MRTFLFHHLDDHTRKHMLSEYEQDTLNNNLYISTRLTSYGVANYPEYMRYAITNGDHTTLLASLSTTGHFNSTYLRQGKACKMPSNAAELLANSEFNRYYIRGVCLNAIESGRDSIIVYRARESSFTRPESEAKIGTALPAIELLEDLRTTIGSDPRLLPEVNSGLSVRFF